MAAAGRDNYVVYARKWRPQTFDDVVGQAHITRTLQNAISNGRIGHAFLFIGSRGIGKTTTARILAKALNCVAFDAPTATPCGVCDNCRAIAEGNCMDVIEIDGASNNTVDDVREIRENVRLVPSRSRYKVYIIDEVHQLSMAAFNALLKTLEEPPAHAIFILATTEAHKVPATIISRCQRFDFRRVAVDGICTLLRGILEKEKVECSEEALFAIARAAEGGIRDAESILDQLVSYCGNSISFQDVFDVLGLVDWRVLHDLCDAILEQDIAKQLLLVDQVVSAGKDLTQFVQDILRYFRNLLVCKSDAAKTLLALPDDEIARMQAHADRFALTNLIRLVEQFAELTKGFDSQLAQRIALEALLIRISKRTVELSVDTVIEKLMVLGESVAGLPSPAAGAPSSPFVRNAAPAATEAPGIADPGYGAGPEPEFDESSALDFDEEPLPEKVFLTNENLAGVWSRVAEIASHSSVMAGVGMGVARPIRVQADTVVLHVSPQAPQAMELLEKPDLRRIVESALADLTENVRTFRCELRDSPAENPLPASSTGSARVGRVNAQDIEEIMKDPHIAKVVDIFKGRVVEIKREVKVAPGER